MSEAENDILFGREGVTATVTLNRPRALNAFTLDMYRRFDPLLRAWAVDPAVHVVVIRGAGGRAFCAGGDVRAIYEAGRGIAGSDPVLTSRFFWEEYELIRRVRSFPKPYIAIVDGIAMGGGMGVSVNGQYRVATENALFAMPETGIGLFPDVGATRFLNLCPGYIGRYLGLTGARIGPADALYCRFATHVMRRDRVPQLVNALAVADADIESLLAACHAPADEPPLLQARRGAIDRCFAGGTIEEILAALDAEAGGGETDAEWAAETRAALLTKSPTSLKITLRQLIVGRECDLDAALALEYRLTQHVMQNHDFYEGVRAVLVDRDRQPRWRPASLAEVSETLVDSYFASLGDGELRFD